MQKAKRTIAICVVLCLLLSVLPVSALAVTITDKPANGTTTGQPFAPGTGGSQNFRIPGIVTLNDGTLVAVCDARWNHSADSSGLDTIVSVSKDNGETWEYTFANYLGDNGNVFNDLSSCIIDPAIATDGTTIYLIADLFPAGMAINTSRYRAQRGSTGYTAEGYLALRSDEENGLTFGQNSYDSYAASANYGYYLKDGAIYTTNGTVVEGYEVDAYFNITGNGVNTNLFFGDSPYKPFPTDYLYMTTSTDGLNWSEPTLINLKAADEQTLLIGPGNGTYDPVSGRMIFTAYEYDWGTQNACLVWRETDGTWYRSENAASSGHWTSEASSVVLDDGTVRIFYRDGYTNLFYSDYVYNAATGNYVVSNREVSTSAIKASNNQLTSIRYSKPVNGKDAILVACSASGSGSRVNGHLYVFTLNEDNTMELAYDYDIFPGENETYAYNCISEMDNGNVALLYENAGAQITYHVIDMEEVLNRENDPRLTAKEVELLEGYSKVFTDGTGYYVDADISELNTEVATLTMTGEKIVTDAAQLGSNVNYNGDVIDLADCLYTFTKGENGRWSASGMDGTVYLYPGNTTSTGYPNRAAAYADLVITEGYEDDTFYIYSATTDNASGGVSYLYFNRSGLTWDRVSSPVGNSMWLTNCSMRLYRPVEGAGSTEIPGYERITDLADVTDGEYLVVAPGTDGNYYALYPNAANTNRYCQIAKLLGRSTVGHTELTFTGVGAGYTEVVIGSTLYQVTVHDVTEVNVDLTVGESATFTEPNGNFADADTSALDTAVATVALSGVNGTTANGLSLAPVSTLTDGTYVIFNTRANKAVTNAPATAAAQAGAGSGLNMSGTTAEFDAAISVWTITKVDGGYTLQDPNGQYMTIGSTTAGITSTPTTLSLNWGGSTWTIAKDGAYLNHFGGGSSTCAAGWQNGSAAGDAGSQFAIYAYSAEPVSASTKITFTGVGEGYTEVLIGHTHYQITVTDGETPHEHSYQAVVTAPTCTEGGYTTYTCSCGHSYVGNETPALGHTYTDDTDIDCDVCGEEREVETVEPEKMTGIVGEGSSVDTSEPAHNKSVGNAFDGDYNTFWATVPGGTLADAYLIADLGGEFTITKVEYTKRYDSGAKYNCTGNLLDYIIEVSTDGETWTQVAAGETVDGTTEITFAPVKAAYVRLTATQSYHWQASSVNTVMCVAELAVYKIAEATHTHTEQTVEGKDATCTETGLTDGVICSDCGEILVEQEEIPALGHDFVDGECSRCDEVEEQPFVNPFVDVKESDFYYDSVMWAVQAGITTGTTDTTFSPVDVCNRAQVVTFLWRAAGEPMVDAENPFVDVKESDFFYNAVLWAVEEGITTGTSDTTFAPLESCTRAQVVTFLWRAAGEPEVDAVNPFVDVKESDFFYNAVLWAVEEGITTGTSGNTFAPVEECNRAQVVTFLFRAQ